MIKDIVCPNCRELKTWNEYLSTATSSKDTIQEKGSFRCQNCNNHIWYEVSINVQKFTDYSDDSERKD